MKLLQKEGVTSKISKGGKEETEKKRGIENCQKGYCHQEFEVRVYLPNN